MAVLAGCSFPLSAPRPICWLCSQIGLYDPGGGRGRGQGDSLSTPSPRVSASLAEAPTEVFLCLLGSGWATCLSRSHSMWLVSAVSWLVYAEITCFVPELKRAPSKSHGLDCGIGASPGGQSGQSYQEKEGWRLGDQKPTVSSRQGNRASVRIRTQTLFKSLPQNDSCCSVTRGLAVIRRPLGKMGHFYLKYKNVEMIFFLSFLGKTRPFTVCFHCCG